MGKVPADVNFTLSDDQIEMLMAYGEVRSHEKGTLLIDEGTRCGDCLVTLSGHTDIIVETTEGTRRLG